MPDTFPNHTPYTGPLPLTVDAYLAGDERRKLLTLRLPDAPAEASHCAVLVSEHGWPLEHPRAVGVSDFGARVLLRSKTITEVAPRVSATGTRWA